MWRRLGVVTPALMMLAWGTLGCQQPQNPSFPLTLDRAERELSDIRDHRKPLERPLVVVGGFNDPGVGPWWVKARLGGYIESGDIHTVATAFGADMESCRQAVIDQIDRAFPTDDPEKTVEVDVVGLSMGGLVARYAAAPLPGKRRLAVARMFTIASPHNGAIIADILTVDDKVLQMRHGSPFLRQLAGYDARSDYRLFCYTRLNDKMVGEPGTAPPGRLAWWVSTPPGESAHIGACTDPRILADVLRRLRDEPAYALDPPAPLPQ